MNLSRSYGRAIWPLVALSISAAVAGGSTTRPKSGILRYEVHWKSSSPGRTGLYTTQKFPETIWFKGDRYRVESFGPTSAPPDAGTGMDRTVAIYAPGVQFGKLTGYRTLWEKGRWNPPFKDGVLVSFGPDALSMTQIRRQKKVGYEKVGQRMTAIYERDTTEETPERFRTRGVRSFARYWVHGSFPVPHKFGIQSRQGQTVIGESVHTLKSAQFNVPLADSLFRPPKDANMHDLIPPKQP